MDIKNHNHSHEAVARKINFISATGQIDIAIENLLAEKIGLDATTTGSWAIAKAVNRRMEHCRLSDKATYLARLQTSAVELQELIELVTVPESWFFRDREAFNFLGRYVRDEWLPKHPGRVLRILSVPCCTGEEPYSIAIALSEAGLVTKNFRIDAVDISKKSLALAQRAVYKSNSFRGNSQGFKERYFQQTEDGFKLSDSIKSTVNFTHGNLLDPLFIVDKGCYDVIFCRNLLIYLHGSAIEQAIQVLHGLLNKHGLLFVGHSEVGQISASKFVSVRQPLTFAYHKAEEQTSRGVGGQRETLSRSGFNEHVVGIINIISQPTPTNQNVLRTAALTTLNTQPSPSNSPTLLETARSLADRGKLDEAATLCETYLSQNLVNADAYVLLGEVCQAAGKEEQAKQYYHKAIYLEPNHYEALMHLALLKERGGDISGAAIFRQRLQRIKTTTKTN